MADFSGAARFFGIGKRKPEAAEPDPADLGTAFGLDMSLDDAEPAYEAGNPRHGWLRRLTGRQDGDD